MKLLTILIIASGLFLAIGIYVEISDPCVRYESRIFMVTTDRGTSPMELRQVCVERKSGWKER